MYYVYLIEILLRLVEIISEISNSIYMQFPVFKRKH